MRWLRSLVGAGGLFFAAFAIVLGVATPWSPAGWSLCGATALGSAAILRPRSRRAFGIAAGCLFAIVVGLRLSGASARGKMLTLPSRGSARVLARMIDEQDASLVGAQLLRLVWRLPRDEREQLLPSMQRAYVEMRGELGTTPSPVLDTFLARQTPSAFDALTIEARTPSRAVVIFLHGYGGSFMLECWLLARAADAIGALTVCPATGFAGHWSSEGERTLRATIDFVHARGARRIYLAGLSNGAVGVAALAPTFASSLSGLVLISGAPSREADGDLPVLVVQGDRDTVASPSSARAYAARSHASYAGFDGGHFVLMTRRDEVRATIATWLTRQERSR